MKKIARSSRFIPREILETCSKLVEYAIRKDANEITENDVERQFEVIDPTFFDAGWIYRGRDEPLEQEIIRRLKNCM